jgi:predicted N-formylglutamate amidohydrolase
MLRPSNDTPQPSLDEPPVELLPGRADGGLLLLCDHASNALPRAYGDLGLPAEEFARHIAYDIGAAAVTRHLAALFEAPAVLTRFSRLLIDPNRGCDDPTLVMRLSDGALIPGNARIDAAEVERRRKLYWQPYREAVRSQIDAMTARGPVPALVSIHSFTPCWKGAERPWQIAILWDSDARIARPLMAALRAEAIVVGDNEPYDGALKGDTLYEHGTRRGLPHVLIEVRQDMIAGEDGAMRWAQLLARVLRPVLAAPDTHMIDHHASRTERRSGGRGP